MRELWAVVEVVWRGGAVTPGPEWCPAGRSRRRTAFGDAGRPGRRARVGWLRPAGRVTGARRPGSSGGPCHWAASGGCPARSRCGGVGRAASLWAVSSDCVGQGAFGGSCCWGASAGRGALPHLAGMARGGSAEVALGGRGPAAVPRGRAWRPRREVLPGGGDGVVLGVGWPVEGRWWWVVAGVGVSWGINLGFGRSDLWGCHARKPEEISPVRSQTGPLSGDY